MDFRIVILATAMLAPNAALAAVTAIANGSPNHIDLSLAVTASVASSCSFVSGSEPSGTYTAPDLIAGFNHEFPFALQCNCPMRVAVTSANGGLLAPVPAPSGYRNLMPYAVVVNIAGDGQSVSAGCEVSTLTAASQSGCLLRGPASPTQGLRLGTTASNVSGSYLKVSAGGYSGTDIPVGSSAYTDTLTVTLSASV